MAAPNVTPLVLGAAAAISLGVYLDSTVSRAASAAKHGSSSQRGAEAGVRRRESFVPRSPSSSEQQKPLDDFSKLVNGHHDSLDDTIREVQFWFN
ncbi:hypothetical protein KFE25_008027 [Diacronema lutheri]|uniref:Uncharacterized protein n=1 Tax=Diacronema lutheri TaxID=2081491 RepID=A0A8J5XKV8_DIALT|nr:hypothetical protein KFE25_008027 [Diacronema lutheri]